MRPLRSKIALLVSYAQEHHYHPGVDPTPGDNPKFVLNLGAYRCVFTFTESHGRLWKHLSVSIPRKGKFPNPAAAFTLATEFGFTGWDGVTIDKIPDGWLGDIDDERNCIVLAQEEGWLTGDG